MVFLALFSPRTRGRKSRWGGGIWKKRWRRNVTLVAAHLLHCLWMDFLLFEGLLRYLDSFLALC